MDELRIGMRLLKLCIAMGALGLLAEGVFELKRLLQPFLAPPSVPGESKIIEHFVVQHLLFPAIGLMVVFWPPAASSAFGSTPFRLTVGLLAVLVTIPEMIVSFRSDLFRPYPFDLRLSWLKSAQMVRIGQRKLNVLQTQHLLLSHACLMGTLLWLSLYPTSLASFAGPHTGGNQMHPAVERLQIR